MARVYLEGIERVVSNGIRRSGTCLITNTARLLLFRHAVMNVSWWKGHEDWISNIRPGDAFVYSYRDLRRSIPSEVRIDLLSKRSRPDDETIISYGIKRAEIAIRQDRHFTAIKSKLRNIELKFESDIVNSECNVVSSIAEFLKLEPSHNSDIAKTLSKDNVDKLASENREKSWSREWLYSTHDHVAKSSIGEASKLPPGFLNALSHHTDIDNWLKERGYT